MFYVTVLSICDIRNKMLSQNFKPNGEFETKRHLWRKGIWIKQWCPNFPFTPALLMNHVNPLPNQQNASNHQVCFRPYYHLSLHHMQHCSCERRQQQKRRRSTALAAGGVAPKQWAVYGIKIVALLHRYLFNLCFFTLID